jgi:hypothetical protein
MSDDRSAYVRENRVVIRSNVDLPSGEDIVYYSVSAAEWFAMTEDEQTKFCVDIAVEHQNNIAGCGASVIPWADVPDDEVIPYD